MVEILVFDDEKKPDFKKNLIAEGIPKPTFNQIIVGMSGCGKSTLLKNYLFNDKFGYNKYFDRIFIWQGSKDDIHDINQKIKKYDIPEKKKIKKQVQQLKQKYKGADPTELDEMIEDFIETAEENLLKTKITIFNKYDNEVLNQIIEESEDVIEEILEEDSNEPLPTTMIIFDDQITNGISNSHKLNAVDTLFTRGRHANISSIITTQKYSKLSATIRQENSTHITLFTGTSLKQLKQIAEDHSVVIDDKELVELMKKQLEKKHSSFTIDKVVKDNTKTYKDTNFNVIDIKK